MRDSTAMKSAEQIAVDLRALESACYYSEDFHWLSSVRVYRDGLFEEERALFRQVVFQRLLLDGSITDVLLCSIDDIPGATPLLAERLNRESSSSQLTRALMEALRRCTGDEAFCAVERFVDSDQEQEALRVLAEIHFARALPYIERASQRPDHRDLVLHILYDRSRVVGLEALIGELRAFMATRNDAELASRLCHALQNKSTPYNPFSEENLRRLMVALHVPTRPPNELS